MTKEQKDKILKALADDRNGYVRDCNMRIAEEKGKITGADYMIQRFLDILATEVELQESEENVIHNHPCEDCYYNDGDVHAECVVCNKAESEEEE